MMGSAWRVVLDLLSVCALFGTAAIALAAYRLQKQTAETMEAEKILDRMAALEKERAEAPSKDDFGRLEARVTAVERHGSRLESSIASVQASIDGQGQMLAAIRTSVNLIQEHLLAQARGGAQ